MAGVFSDTRTTLDAKHKLIRRYEVTDASVHDSQKLDELLTNTKPLSG